MQNIGLIFDTQALDNEIRNDQLSQRMIRAGRQDAVERTISKIHIQLNKAHKQANAFFNLGWLRHKNISGLSVAEASDLNALYEFFIKEHFIRTDEEPTHILHPDQDSVDQIVVALRKQIIVLLQDIKVGDFENTHFEDALKLLPEVYHDKL